MHYLYLSSQGRTVLLPQPLHSPDCSAPACKYQPANVSCLNFLFSLLLPVDHSLMMDHSSSKMRGWRSHRGIDLTDFSMAFCLLAFQCFKSACVKYSVSEKRDEVQLQLEDYFSSAALAIVKKIWLKREEDFNVTSLMWISSDNSMKENPKSHIYILKTTVLYWY